MRDAAVERHEDPLLDRFVETFIAQFEPHLVAVLLYGSYVRGKRDTVLDFYVLLDSYAPLSCLHGLANRALAPNVYQLVTRGDTAAIACKYATVTMTQFAGAIEGDFHTYFWARFAQPCQVVYACDAHVRKQLETLFGCAAKRMIAATAPLLATPFTSAELWQRAFALTYGCELRAEDSRAAARLYAAYAAPLDAAIAAHAAEIDLIQTRDGRWQPNASRSMRARARWAWQLRRLLGKAFSIARLLKAAYTFNDPLDYVVWKVARHSGVNIEPSTRARRYPLIFGWGVIWRLYRRGGFR